PSKDPLVKKYETELLESDFLIFIHPNWWGQPPAILKGYIDRVIRPPQTYDFPANETGGGVAIGKLKGKIGIVFNTSNTEKEREDLYFHDPLEYIWKKCVFGFCGIEESYRTMFRIITDSTVEERNRWLRQTAESLTAIIKKRADQKLSN
ncbi:MAG: NAD(P)H-dependent oxidoreductase, partial [Treponemataceae bacterium]